jgi:hypothetical protein
VDGEEIEIEKRDSEMKRRRDLIRSGMGILYDIKN